MIQTGRICVLDSEKPYSAHTELPIVDNPVRGRRPLVVRRNAQVRVAVDVPDELPAKHLWAGSSLLTHSQVKIPRRVPAWPPKARAAAGQYQVGDRAGAFITWPAISVAPPKTPQRARPTPRPL